MCGLLALFLIASGSALIYANRDSQLINGPITLYNEILNIKRQLCPPTTLVQTLKLHAQTTLTTLSTLSSLASRTALEQFFGPSHKVGNTLVISYYHSGAWRYALTKSPTSPSPIVSIKAKFASSLFDVTPLVSPMLGPSGDCYGLKITPFDLDYDSLTVNLLANDQRESTVLQIGAYEDIGAKVKQALGQ
jgi:hypothetical protein